jgi:colanic acid/amylovoran biosynthesis glycosyltransferase
VLCLIGFDDNKVIKDFIRIHAELLPCEKICLSGSFPDFQFRGQNIRKLFQQPTWRRRLGSLLPHAITSRRLLKLQNSQSAVNNALVRFFRSEQITAVLAEFGDAGAAIAPVAELAGIPLIVHFHGHDAHRSSLLTPELRLQYRNMFRSAAAVLGVSRSMLQALQELGCPPEKLIYNPYGPRDKFLQITPDYRPTVLSVGRFTDIKANYLVLMAFQQALQQVPHARLVMAGNGELLETCKTLAAVWGLQHSVDFIGPVEHSQVHQLFQKACCFAQHSVCPSYGDAEGTPNTILEASAAALPVVATRHAGIPDVVIDGVTGLLVNERDVHGMASAMIRVLSDQALARSLGEAGRNRVRTHFSSGAHINRLNRAIQIARNCDAAGIAALAAETIGIGI